jgi:hypothetical protein
MGCIFGVCVSSGNGMNSHSCTGLTGQALSAGILTSTLDESQKTTPELHNWPQHLLDKGLEDQSVVLGINRACHQCSTKIELQNHHDDSRIMASNEVFKFIGGCEPGGAGHVLGETAPGGWFFQASQPQPVISPNCACVTVWQRTPLPSGLPHHVHLDDLWPMSSVGSLVGISWLVSW